MVDKEISMFDEENLMFDVKVPMFDLRSFLSEVKILVRKTSYLCWKFNGFNEKKIMSDVEILIIVPFYF